ncbi:MAG: hypothetical protein AAFN30_03650 [Actinomycetota bacterium]
MFIFTRTRTIDPARAMDALTGATELSRTVESLSDLSLSTWFQQYGPTGPAIRWTARLEHLEDYDKAFERLVASEAYHDAVAEVDELFIGMVTDDLLEVVAGDLPSTPTPITASVQATAANGHIRSAIHWGADLAERFGRSLDVPTIFVRGLYGTYGTIAWGSFFDDINQVEGTHAKMATDEMLQAVIDEGAHNCQPGASAVLMRKLD